jgi:hypothetical protein
MRRVPDTQERLAALFVVLGAAGVFGPVVWLLDLWRQALVREPENAWGAQWLGEGLSAHPYLTAGALLLGVVLASGLLMLVLVTAARRLAARFAGGARFVRRGARG